MKDKTGWIDQKAGWISGGEFAGYRRPERNPAKSGVKA